MNENTFKYIINVKPYIQPLPVRHTGGDCFCCVFTAAFQYMFPEKEITFDMIFKWFESKSIGGKYCTNNAWYHYPEIIRKAMKEGYDTEIKSDICRPAYEETHLYNYAWYKYDNEKVYAKKVLELLKDKWIIIHSIKDVGTTDPKRKHTDHLILIDGVKAEWIKMSDIAKRLTYFVRVVCSNKRTYWITVNDFFELHGAAAWWQIRRLYA